MAGELEAVHAAAAKLKDAKTGDDTLTAMMGVQDMATSEAGAKAAGVDEERYKLIRSNLSAAASYLAPTIGGVDTTMLSADQRAEMKRTNQVQPLVASPRGEQRGMRRGRPLAHLGHVLRHGGGQ